MTVDIHGHFVDPHYLDELKRVMTLDIEKTADGKTLMRHNGYTLAWTRADMFDMDHRLRDMDAKGITTRGKNPIALPNGETRTFLQDGDEVIFRARCDGAGRARVGFGECRAVIAPART